MRELLLSELSLVALGIVALWMAILLLAKRRREARVSLVPIWQRLLAKPVVLPKRQKIRRLLALLMAVGFTFAATYWLGSTLFPRAGKAENRLPIDLVCVIDTSPSTLRQRVDAPTTLDALFSRAEVAAAALSPVDRVWLMWRESGVVATAGPFAGTHPDLAKLKQVRPLLHADFTGNGTQAYRQALAGIASTSTPWADDQAAKEWPELIAAFEKDSQRERHLALFSDHDQDFLALADDPEWQASQGLAPERIAKTAIGAHGFDYRFSGVEYRADGRLLLNGYFPPEIEFTFFSGIAIPTERYRREGNQIEILATLPKGENGIRITLDRRGDALPANNEIELVGRPEIPLSIGFVARNDFFADALKKVFAEIIPAGTRRAHFNRGSWEELSDTIVVAEGESFRLDGHSTRAVVCFGDLPARYQVTSVKVAPPKPVHGTLRMPAAMIGEEDSAELYDIRIKSAKIPTYPAEGKWQVLLNIEGLGPLVAYSEAYGVPILHIATALDDSTLMHHPALPLLLRRWLTPMMLPKLTRDGDPPLYRNGDIIPLPFSRAHVALKPLDPQGEEMRWEWRREGEQLGFAETWTPGEYTFHEVAAAEPRTLRVKAQWFVDSAEIPPTPVAARAAPEFAPIAYEPSEPLLSTREMTLLFLIALGFLVLEWALFWFGASE